MEIALRHETAEAIQMKPPVVEGLEADEVPELIEAAQ
jgi:hypothetical protein